MMSNTYSLSSKCNPAQEIILNAYVLLYSALERKNMDSGLDSKHNSAYRTRWRKWFFENLPPDLREDSEEFAPLSFDRRRQWEKRLFAAGFAGITWPVEFGGQGLTIIEQ